MAIAIEWSTRLMAIGLEMALPAAGGYWLDLRVGTSPLFVILGAILGFRRRHVSSLADCTTTRLEADRRNSDLASGESDSATTKHD